MSVQKSQVLAVQRRKSIQLRFGIRLVMISMVIVAAFFAGRTSIPEPSDDLNFVPSSVAIAGRPDLDGDGKPDLSRLMKILSEIGCEVVAIENADGKVCGELNRYTRFLIIPEQPTNLAEPNKLVAFAKKNNVEIVTWNRFLGRAGVQFRRTFHRLDNRKIESKTRSAFDNR